MENSRIVREVTEYEDGTIEERILSKRDEKKEYEAPAPSPLMTLGLLALGGIAVYLLWKYRYDIQYRTTQLAPGMSPETTEAPSWETPESAPGGYGKPETVYKAYRAETPRPMVDASEYVGPVSCTGRVIR